MLHYHGQELDSWDSKRQHRRTTEPSLLHSLGSRQKKQLVQTQTRPASSSEDKLTKRSHGIWVNVSGKRYHLPCRLLSKFPNSLLADQEKRSIFYDPQRDELFFDRNRIAFDSVYVFYRTSGMLVTPDGNFPEQLLADEIYFFGLYSYLSSVDRKFKLLLPSALKKQEIAPSRRWQKVLWKIFELPDSSFVARVINLVSLLVIVFSVVILFAETIPSFKGSESTTLAPDINSTSDKNFKKGRTFKAPFKSVFHLSEMCCIAWFTLEFVLRFIASPEKCRFLKTASNIIDFIAIAPFYISLIASKKSLGTPLYILRVLRLSKVFRILKISRWTSALIILSHTVKASLYDLWTMCFLTTVGTILFGSLVYYCEQWNEDTEFHSIPEACWWAVVTITTLGYGDLVPTTLGGKIVGGVCSVSGVLLITPFLPIIYNKFNRFQQMEKYLTGSLKNKPNEKEKMVYALDEINSMIYKKKGRRFTL